jgi:hypothetical protein
MAEFDPQTYDAERIALVQPRLCLLRTFDEAAAKLEQQIIDQVQRQIRYLHNEYVAELQIDLLDDQAARWEYDRAQTIKKHHMEEKAQCLLRRLDYTDTHLDRCIKTEELKIAKQLRKMKECKQQWSKLKPYSVRGVKLNWQLSSQPIVFTDP